MSASTVERLVSDSEEGLLLGQSEAYESARFDEEAAERAAARVETHPDATSYHLLLALAREAPGVYGRVDPATRARVLVAALRDLPKLNDWGFLEPGGGHDRLPAQLLVELGDAAIPALVPLLDDTSPARLIGSEPAAMSHRYGYRRSDFALRYLSQILGREAAFAADPAERDGAIAELKAALSS